MQPNDKIIRDTVQQMDTCANEIPQVSGCC